MAKLKKCVVHFCYYDLEGMQQYLQNMSMCGWALKRILPCYWEFEEIQPQFRTYFISPKKMEKVSFSDELPPMWHEVTTYYELHIYYAQGENMPLLEPQSPKQTLAELHKTMKYRVLPSQYLTLLICIFMMRFSYQSILQEPLRFLANGIFLYFIVVWGLLLLYQFVGIASYILWRKKCFHTIKSEHKLAQFGKSKRVFGKVSTYLMYVLLFVQTCLLLFYVFAQRIQAVIPLILGCLIVAVFLWKASHKRQRTVKAQISKQHSLILTAVLPVCIIGGMTYTTIYGRYGDFLPRLPVEVYEDTLSTGIVYPFPIYQDDLIVSLEDFMEIQQQIHYSKQHSKSTSGLVSYQLGIQNAPVDSGAMPELTYEVWDSNISSIISYIETQITTSDSSMIEYVPIDLNGVSQAYQQYYQEKECSEFLFVTPTRIVRVCLNFQPTNEQLQMIEQKFFSNI